LTVYVHEMCGGGTSKFTGSHTVTWTAKITSINVREWTVYVHEMCGGGTSKFTESHNVTWTGKHNKY